MKKRNKKAFTLIELMVTLAIFSVVVVLISAILMQGQIILSKVNNRTIIQDEIRTALLKIQSEAQNSSEAIVNNKFGKFSNNKWLLDSTDNTARELVRFIKEGEDTSKVYVEFNDGNKHQLIEFSINKTTNEIVENSTNILINEIDGSDADSISVNVEDINDSNGNKINDLVTINCSSIVKGEDINESDYLISFINKNENVINIGIGNISGSGQGSGSTNDNNNNSGSNIEIEDTLDNNWVYDWKADGVEIKYNIESSWNDGTNNITKYNIEIKNNTGYLLWDWQLGLNLINAEITECYGGNLIKEENKIKPTGFDDTSINKDHIKVISIVIRGSNSIKEQDISFMYKKVIEPNKEIIDLKDGIQMNLYNYSQWNGTGKWEMSIKNTSNKKVEKWELIFDCEKEIKNVSWGLYYEKIGESRYKIKNYNDSNSINNSIKENDGVIYLYFESYSGVVDRNLKNIEFKIVN